MAHNDRRQLFRETAARQGIGPGLAEKDFWVCWSLHKLFSCPEISPHVIFKGGTCLSKVYHVIERFSEDIDLILNWKMLTRDDPCGVRSNTAQQKFNKTLEEGAERYIREHLFPLVRGLVSPACTASVDSTDGHVMLVGYPAVFGDDYVFPFIRLEIGPLAAWNPHGCYRIRSYAAETFPHLFSIPETEVRAIRPERIFWEKVTILHSESHRPEGKIMPLRYSRHYYDVYKLALSSHKISAIENI
jgi:predicted nucleotidyltransferase component of viral defense system